MFCTEHCKPEALWCPWAPPSRSSKHEVSKCPHSFCSFQWLEATFFSLHRLSLSQHCVHQIWPHQDSVSSVFSVGTFRTFLPSESYLLYTKCVLLLNYLVVFLSFSFMLHFSPQEDSKCLEAATCFIFSGASPHLNTHSDWYKRDT